jgi:Ca2+-binding RTX toxin-like protein
LPLVVLAMFLAAAPSAMAAGPTTVTVDAGEKRIDVVAAASTANELTVTQGGGNYTITDTAGVSSPTCTPSGVNTVVCADLGPDLGREIDINVGDLEDTVTINAGPDTDVTLAAGSGDDAVTSPGSSRDRIFGNVGSDTLNGGDGDDSLYGGNGFDILEGGQGNDVIFGGTNLIAEQPETTGNIFRGGPGDDVLEGNKGPDIFDEGAVANGNDRANGNDGLDVADYSARTNNVVVNFNLELGDFGILSGESGEGDVFQEGVEVALGGSGDDLLLGSRIGNVLIGGAGADVMCGYLGYDTVDYSGRDTPVNVTLGADDADPTRKDCEPVEGLVDEKGADDCVANDGGALDRNADCVGEDVEKIVGGSADDVLVGNDPRVSPIGEPRGEISGKNILEGGGGNDILDGRLGADTFDGGDGSDWVTYASRVSPVNGTLDGAADDGNAVLDVDTTDSEAPQRENILPNVENVIGGAGSDSLKGSDSDNVLEGRSGNDFINGGGGADSVIGGIGDDELEGDTGDDNVQGFEGQDSLDGGEGTDTLNGGTGDDRLVGGIGPDTFIGGDGTDQADYSASLARVVVSANGVADDGTVAENDNVGSDVESLSGGIDNDLLIGGPGDGILSGGAGDDVLDGGGGADVLLGGDGADTASYAGRVAPVTADLSVPGGDGEANENDNIASDVEKITGGAGNDTLTGDAAGNVLNGLGGDDTLNGGDAFDQLLGGEGNDTANGDGGNDFLRGEGGNDALNGGEGEDKVEGGTGDDLLDGGPGADVLSGETGSDTASYALRSADVSVTLDGAANDGQSGENDFIRTDVANVTTGSGDDNIDSRDGKAGKIRCGAGSDVVDADTDDDADGSCEVVNRSAASSLCSVTGQPSVRGGTVSLRVRCPIRAAGTLVLETAGAVRAVNDSRKKARKVRLGSKRFRITRAGQRKTLKVKLSSKGKRLLNRKKRLRVRAVLRFRPMGVSKAATKTRRSSKVVTITKKRGGK